MVGSIVISQPETADEWEVRVSEVHGALTVLDEVRDVLVRVRVQANPCGDSGEYERNDTIERLQQELLECKEDLKRDEEIFTDKVNELNRFR